jgi:hypothetical protein
MILEITKLRLVSYSVHEAKLLGADREPMVFVNIFSYRNFL